MRGPCHPGGVEEGTAVLGMMMTVEHEVGMAAPSSPPSRGRVSQKLLWILHLMQTRPAMLLRMLGGFSADPFPSALAGEEEYYARGAQSVVPKSASQSTHNTSFSGQHLLYVEAEKVLAAP